MKLGILADIHEHDDELRRAIAVLSKHGADPESPHGWCAWVEPPMADLPIGESRCRVGVEMGRHRGPLASPCGVSNST